MYLPRIDAGATNFYDANGGTAIVTAAADGYGGTAEVFVSGVNAATVKQQTLFNL